MRAALSAIWALGEPKGVPVAMSGPTGLDMLICRNESVASAPIYAQSCVVFHVQHSAFTSHWQLLRNLFK